MAACLNVAADIISPAGFDISDRALRRAGLDYLDMVKISRWPSFEAFKTNADASGARLVLLTTQASGSFHAAAFRPTDILLAGRESAGVPKEVHEAANMRVRIPMRNDTRSLNVAVALSMVLGEALRQTGGFSGLT